LEFSFLVNSQVLNEWTHTDIIDPTNAILLSLIAKYDNPHNRLEHDSEGRVWINLSYVTHQIPWISLNSDNLGKRLKKLAEVGLIDRSQKKTQQGSKLYFRMSDKYRKMEAWYDELHSIESNSDKQNIQSAISIHYSKKPKIEGNDTVEPVDNSIEPVDNFTENTVKEVSHPLFATGDPNSINPNSKKRGEESNTSIEEGELVDNSPPPSLEKPEKENQSLYDWIESHVEKDGAGHFYLHIETKRTIDHFKSLYGARWVCEEFKNLRENKVPDKFRNFFKTDFPGHLWKASKNKSPPRILPKPKICPVCNYVVRGNMGSCGVCGLDVELFNDQKAIDKHRNWYKSRKKGTGSNASQEFFVLFKDRQEKAG